MRILFVSHSFPPPDQPTTNLGGMQRVAVDLHEALSKLPNVELRSRLLRTTWASTHRRVPGFLFGTIWELRRLIKSGEVDVILFSSMVTASLSIVVRRSANKAGVQLCTIVHGLDVTTAFSLYQSLVRKVFQKIDRVFPVSSATAAACLERGLDASKVRVIPNGISINRFESNPDRSSARTRIAELLDQTALDDSFILCSVGRQVKRKGFDWFVDNVLGDLDEDVHYVLAGEGPLQDDIREAARRNNLSNRVHLLGRVSEQDLQTLYRAADIFVMPNIHVPGDMEGFGVVMLEAGLAGLPVVASNIEGILDVVVHNENGLLVQSAHAHAFSSTLTSLKNDRSRLAGLAARASDSVLERFEWRNVAQSYVDAMAEKELNA